ncbi:MAG: tetratricopeptide repeat protein [Alphaproteobacteria bacterium]
MLPGPVSPPKTARCPARDLGRGLLRAVSVPVLAVLLLASPAMAQTVETVQLRDGVHRDYSRLVLDYDQKTRFEVIYQTRSELVLRLKSPEKPVLSGFNPANHDRISRVTASAKGNDHELVIALSQPVRLKAQNLGTKLVLDLYAVEDSRAQPRPQIVTSAEAQAPGAGPQLDPDAEITAEDVAPGDEDIAELLDRLAALEDSVRVDDVNQQTELARTAPAPETPEWSDFVADSDDMVAVGETHIRIDPGAPVGAAIFTRGTTLWVVIDTPKIEAAPLISGTHARVLRQSAKPNAYANRATIYRFPLPPETRVQTRRDGRVWQVKLSAHAGLLKNYPLRGEALGDSGRGELLLLAEGLAQPMTFADPEVGDELILLPSTLPGEGMENARQLADVAFLTSAQGAAIRPLVSGLRVETDGNGALITHDAGLRLSSRWLKPPATVEELEQALLPQDSLDLDGKKLFDFARWMRNTPDRFFWENMKFQQEIATMDPADRPAGNLELAKFLMAQGFPEEAAGALRLATSADPRLDSLPDVRALRGAVLALTGDPEEEGRDLLDPALEGLPEAKLWFGIAAARAGDWGQASKSFNEGGLAALDYPAPVFNRIAPMMLDSALEQGNTRSAERVLERLKETADGKLVRAALLAYYSGEVARRKGDVDKARRFWSRAAESTDFLYRTKSVLQLVDLGLRDGEMTAEDAINKLEPLRFGWRGDTLELAVLNRLARIYNDEGRFREGFDILAKSASYFPNTNESEAIKQATIAEFVAVFADGRINKVSPIEAYGFYNDFKHLTPKGAGGAVIIERLAERLIEVDLADQAADLLTELVTDRLQGVERARVGTRAAAMRILAERPLEALDVLEGSESRGMPKEMQRNRHLLKVRATADLGNADDALAMLEGRTGPEVERLRADLAQQAGDWALVADSLAKLLDPPQPGKMLEAEQAQIVLSRAVALALAKDNRGLDALRMIYGDAMRGTDQDHAFHLVARGDLDPSDRLSMQSIRRAMREVDLFEEFLNSIGSNPEQGSLETASLDR